MNWRGERLARVAEAYALTPPLNRSDGRHGTGAEDQGWRIIVRGEALPIQVQLARIRWAMLRPYRGMWTQVIVDENLTGF